jgi:LPS sulfotransferase NodH
MNIEKPIIVIGAPRSGTTLLFSILSSNKALWSLYAESESIFRKHVPANTPAERGNELDETDATPEIVAAIRADFYRKCMNYQTLAPNSYTKVYTNRTVEKLKRMFHTNIIAPLSKPKAIRIVEKTPKNCLRIPFINAIFPDAFFVFLYREPRTNISSLIEGWRQGKRYGTAPLPEGSAIAGYDSDQWNFLRPQGWQRYTRNVSLAEVCAFQYAAANERALESLKSIPQERQMNVRYEDLVAASEAEVKRIAAQTGLAYDGAMQKMAAELPPVNTTSTVDDNKWKMNEAEIVKVLDSVSDVAKKLGYAV